MAEAPPLERRCAVARRRMTVAAILEIIVAWDAGESISQIARRLGYTRVTVRKYAEAARQLGRRRGGGRRREADWQQLAQAVVDRVARQRAPGAATPEGAR